MTNETQAPERIWVWPNEPHGELVVSTAIEPKPDCSTEYIRADLARPRVKPLVWEEACYGDNVEWIAEVLGQEYQVGMKNGVWFCYNYTHDLEITCGNSLEDALAAAQADYERRILKALEPTPDDARAALEAMLAEARR